MGIYAFANPKTAATTTDPAEFSRSRGASRKVVAIDLPFYASDHSYEPAEDLGCMRGIAFALAIQAALALLAFAVWMLV